jgi:DNA primase
MDIESMGYVEALRFLAKKYNITLEESETDLREEKAKQSEKEAVQIVMNFALEFFKRNLTESEEGKSIGLSYFKERGLRSDIIESFGLGYALNEWDGLMKEAEKKQHNLDLLEKAGLILKNDETHKTYDRFRGRVTFPILNVSGKVIAFGARMLGSDKNQPKYINSPESVLYDKSNALYGLYQARQAIRVSDMCYLTEGYMDVIAMHQAGIGNTVASSGTSLTEGQIKLVGRFTQNLTLLYDGDKAGIKASLRGIDLIVAAGLNVRAVVLPDGHDPDSYAKAFGASTLEEFLKSHTQDFISFKAGLAAEEAAADPFKKAESIDSILETISLVSDVIKRSVFITEASRLFKMSEEAMTESLNLKIYEKLRKPKPRIDNGLQDLPPLELPESPYNQEFKEKRSIIYDLEREIVRILILHGHKTIEDQYLIATYVFEQLAEVEFKTDSFKRMIVEYSERLDFGDELKPEYFFHHNDEFIKRLVIDMCSPVQEKIMRYTERSFDEFADMDEQQVSKSLYSNILQLKKQYLFKEMEELRLKLENLENVDEELIILTEIHEKKKIEIELSKELGSVMNHF